MRDPSGLLRGLGRLGRRLGFFGRLVSLLGQEYGVNVGQDATVSNGYSLEELSQLLIVPHRQQNVPRYNPVLLVVSGSISRQLQNLHNPQCRTSGRDPVLNHLQWCYFNFKHASLSPSAIEMAIGKWNRRDNRLARGSIRHEIERAHFSGQILQHGSEVNWSARSDTL